MVARHNMSKVTSHFGTNGCVTAQGIFSVIYFCFAFGMKFKHI